MMYSTQCSCKIPTAIPIFSKSRNSMKLFSSMCDACEKQQFKIAAHTQEILMFASRLLTLLALDNVENSFTEFLKFENMGTAVGIMQLRCIKAYRDVSISGLLAAISDF